MSQSGLLPARLGKYEIRGTLGRGAMGVVHDGWDPLIGRRVAIKTVPLLDQTDPVAEEGLARFRREAQAAGRLSHPNIVGVYDYGETETAAYIVLEFIEGHSLKERLDGGELFSPAESVRLLQQVLAALQFSHAAGVVHRDVKPGNIMLTADGRVKLADFGIARIESSTMTQDGSILGTPAYMSPEQLTAQGVDARSDLYAAGVVLYQLLTGERPFQGGMAAITHKVLNTVPPKPSDLSVTAPPALDAVVARAMSRRPADRYPDAQSFATALAGAWAAAEHGSVAPPADDATAIVTAPRATSPAASPPPVPPRVAAAAPRSRRGVWLAGAGVAALLLAAAGGWVALRPGGGDGTSAAVLANAGPTATAASPTGPKADAGAPAPGTTPRTAPSTATGPVAAAAPPTAPKVEASAAAPGAPPAADASAGAAPHAGAAATAPVPPPSRTVEAALTPPPPAMVVPPPLAPQAGPRGTTPADVPAALPPVTPPAAVDLPLPPPVREAAIIPTLPATPPPPEPAVKPVVMQAPVPTTPAAAAPDPAVLREGLAALRRNARCALPRLDVSAAGGIEVAGLVGAGAPAAALREAAQSTAPAAPLAWNATDIDGPFCDALDLVRPVAAPPGSPAALELSLRDGAVPLHDHDLITPVVRLPDYPAYLQVDYISHDGSILHMYPVRQTPERPLPQSASISVREQAHAGWTVGPPFGTDMIIAVASSVPLFAPRRLAADDTVGTYLPALQAAMEAARRHNGRVVGQALAVQTLPK